MAKKRKRNQKTKTPTTKVHKSKEAPHERPLPNYAKGGIIDNPPLLGQSDTEETIVAKQDLKQSTPQLAEIGRTGLIQFSGFLGEEDSPQLRNSTEMLKIYKEMRDNSPIVGAIIFTIDMFMRQVDWWVEPADPEEPASVEDAEWLETNLHDMSSSWEDTLSEVMSFVVWGWSNHELVYKIRSGHKPGSPGKSSKFNDGRFGWRKLPIRGQDTLNRWLFDEEGGLEGMEQIAAPDYQTRQIPIQKSLLFRTQVYKGNPEGKALLRTMFRPWYFMKRIETFEAIGVERDLAGLPVMTVPSEWTSSTATTAEKSAYEDAKNLVINIRRDEQEGIVIPAVYDDNGNQLVKLELLTSGGKRNFDTDKIIQRYSTQITLAALADFLFLGHESVGSFALSSDKTNLFSVALGTWLDMIAAVFNRHAIPRLWELNGLDMDTIPTLRHGDLERKSPEIISAFVKNLTAAGLKFDDLETQNFLRRIVDFPEVEEDFLDNNDEVVEAVNQMTKEMKEAL